MQTDGPLASRTILIVDDSPSVRGVLEAALTDAGATTWLSEDGEAAVALLETRVPELILLDLVMPRLNGWGVIERLRQTPRLARIPVILETSAEDYSAFDRARRDGVAAFISKPFRLNEVIETCRRVFDGARPLQGRKAAGEGDAAYPVEVRGADGRLLVNGDLVDVDANGAQVEVATPIPLGSLVSLVPLTSGGSILVAEVRWVTRVGDRYCQGLLLRKSAE
jgi:two-component system, chemotaxis family, chemotaxis protein CheY